MRLPGRSRPLRPPRVLAVDLSRPVTDEPATGPLARLVTARRSQLRELTEAVDEAADDAGVAALLVRVDHPATSWAHAEELRGAIMRFAASGKRTVAHAQSFGEAGPATLAYYVATAFGEIHLQPSGELALTGLAAEVPFVADLLDKLDVTPQLAHRREYKSAKNLLTERAFTEAHREATDRIVESHHEQLIAAVAEGRGLGADRAAALVDDGPKSAAQARDAGLVDRLVYRDESTADVKDTAGHGSRLLSLTAYRSVLRRRRLWPRRRTAVALVNGHGAIRSGHSRRSPLGTTMGSDTVVTGFQQAIRDRKVAAILFRVDSPGGSAVASDAVWRAVVRAREAGKPVVVSMGSVAGSGGYWVAMDADRIVASPGTLTGSIGVVGGKLVTRGLKQRLGITTDEAHRGSFALMHSSNEPYSDEHWQRIDASLDRIYDLFVDKVASGRDLPRERVDELARGRVWTGADAAASGLVDELGGYREALVAVRRALRLADDAPLRLRTLPRQPLAERLGLRQANPEDARAQLEAAGDALRAVGVAGRDRVRTPDWVRALR